MDEDCLRRLTAAFTADTDRELLRAVQEGVLLGDDLVDSSPLLRTAVGRDLRGLVRRAGVMFRVNDLCKKGDLPFVCEFVPMPHGRWHWLEVRSGAFKAHICRTEALFDFPEETRSRQDERLRNQGDLFKHKIVVLRDVVDSILALYTWLNYGADKNGKLTHLCWAMPPADSGEWLAHVDILRRIQTSSESATPAEKPSASVVLRFKDHIEEALTDEDDDKTVH